MRLWRYNYSILLGGNWWIIVLPTAATVIVMLWMMALSTEFGQQPATRIGELLTPILGAFLVSHSLAPEYRSSVGAVLACKPVSLHRVVTIRAGLAILVALGFTAAALIICSFALRPIDVVEPILASLPGLWFLSMLALTFATLFRNALAGFGVAAALWILDFLVGYAIHPFLSLQGLFSFRDGDPLATLWQENKAVLLIAGTALLFIHGRLLPRICRAPERRDVSRIAVVAAGVLLLYCGTGAATTVAYAYAHRGNLDQADVDWLRRQLKLYGPVPVSRFFGSAFNAYVAEPPPAADGGGPRAFRTQQLEQALERWPRSIWADSIAFALAVERERTEPVRAVADYFAVADRFGRSPFAPRALGRVLRSEAEIPSEVRLRAARRVVADYPRSPEVERAAEVLAEHYPAEISNQEMLTAAQLARQAAPPVRQPQWLVLSARVLAEQGEREKARAAAQQAVEQVTRLETEVRENAPSAPEIRPHFPRIHGNREAALRLLEELGKP